MKNIIVSQSLIYDEKNKVFKDQLDTKVVNFIMSLNYTPVAISNGIKNPKNFLKKINFRAIILTGGADFGLYPKRDKLESYLIKYAIHKKIPLLGICRGMQMINKHFRGNLNTIKGHVRKRHQVRDVNTKKKFVVNSYHNFSVDEKKLHKALTPVHRCTKDNSIESFVHSKHKLFGIMWHPEREKKFRSLEKNIIKKFFKK